MYYDLCVFWTREEGGVTGMIRLGFLAEEFGWSVLVSQFLIMFQL